MKELWDVFIEARTNKVTPCDQDDLLTITDFIDRFDALFPLTFDQKETMENLLILLSVHQQPFYDLHPFLAFLFPMDQIEKSKKIYRELLPLFSTESISSQRDKILQCLKKNDISNDIIQTITQFPFSKETHIWVLGFSYLYNEVPSFAPSYRQQFLRKYSDLFNLNYIQLPKKWFVTEDINALTIYEQVEKEMRTNSLLRLAFLISFKKEHATLSTFLTSVEDMYNEINALFTRLFDYIQKENLYAKS